MNTATHRHCIVPANNRYHYDTPEKALFGTTNQEFTRASLPASVTQYGASMDKPLTDIRYDAQTGKTTLHFRGGSNIGAAILSPEDRARYDLTGRPMLIPAEGIYIQDGKKHLK